MNTYDIRLSCNDASIEPYTPVRIHPGRRNFVAATYDVMDDICVLRVERVAPDGRTFVTTSPFVAGRAEASLGPMCAPAVYEYEAGVVYRRGYSLRLSVQRTDNGAILARYGLAAVCSQDADAEWLIPGAPARCVYNDGFVSEGKSWNPFGESAGAMEPALQMRLSPQVLVDRDHVELRYRTRPNPAAGAMSAQLRIRDAEGRDMVEPVELDADDQWRSWQPCVTTWPEGTYTVELLPMIEGEHWPDGPVLRYRRDAADHQCVRVSPYAPFGFERDAARDDVVITDWPSQLPEGWQTAPCGEDMALLSDGDPDAPSVIIDPKLKGMYAVFIEPVHTIHVRVGRNDVVRRVHESECEAFGDMFVDVADLTGQTIELLPNDLNRLLQAMDDDDPQARVLELYEQDGTRSTPFDRSRHPDEIRSGVRRIRLMSVTDASVRAFREATMHPPYELRGVDDWWCHFLGWHRADVDQFDTLLRAQREVGMRTLNWAVGRSWVQYPTRLAEAQMFPCVPIPEDQPIERRHHWISWDRILRTCDTLGYPLSRRAGHDIRLHGWLAMNRHYGAKVQGGVFTSRWAASHPQYYQTYKDQTTVDYSRVEYYFPEVRKERLDILEEVAAYSPDGVVLGCCRQPPMASYHPRMVAEYKTNTGIDPTTLDIDAGQPYLDWIQWRAGFFTELLRELAERLKALKARTGHRVPVIARVPGVGMQWNLAQGIDVHTWVTEGLIDELQLDPLECAAGQASHDVRPYLALCHAHGVPVFGGVNGTTGANRGYGSMEDFTPVVGLRRAIGLLRAGVDGIEIYEAELFARGCERRWLIPLWGDPCRAEQWLAASNLEAVHPVTARNAALGHDNHWFGSESLHGVDALPRGAKRAL